MGKNDKSQPKDDKQKTNLIGNYDKLRDLLRISYLYGSFDEDYLRQLNVISSPRKYANDLREIKTYLKIEENKPVLADGSKGKKELHIPHRMHEDEYNYFCNTYKMKSLVQNKVTAYLLLMQLLDEEQKTTTEVTNSIPDTMKDFSGTVNYHLNDLEELGFVEIDKTGNKNQYRIKRNFFESDLFNDNDFVLRFLDFISLMRNKIQPYVCGNMLLEIALMFFDNNNAASELVKNYISPFFVNDGHFEQVLDDGVLYMLIRAMDSGRSVSFSYGENEYDEIYPIKAVTHIESGLRYLFAYINNDKKYQFFALDEITDLKLSDNNCFDYDLYEEKYKEKTKYSFSGVTCLNDGEKPVELTLHVRNSDFLKLIKTRFEYTEIKTLADKSYSIIVMVNTLAEIKPWLRRNMNNVRFFGDDVMCNELKEMKKLYGIV